MIDEIPCTKEPAQHCVARSVSTPIVIGLNRVLVEVRTQFIYVIDFYKFRNQPTQRKNHV